MTGALFLSLAWRWDWELNLVVIQMYIFLDHLFHLGFYSILFYLFFFFYEELEESDLGEGVRLTGI